jgi:hypothetical protein
MKEAAEREAKTAPLPSLRAVQECSDFTTERRARFRIGADVNKCQHEAEARALPDS